jgi:transcriptional regulator of nitric oxide reductase
LVLSGDASGEVKVNSDGELEFPEGKNVDIALTDQKQGDVVTLVFEGKMYGDSEKLALKNAPAASRGTRAKDDMELISGAEYEVLQSGNIVLTVAAQEAPVTLKGITSTPANTSDIRTIDAEQNAVDSWYDMNGRKLQGKPTRKGMYIHSGHKTIIK